MANSMYDGVRVWVIADEPSDACRERLGDARRLADTLDLRVGVLLLSSDGVTAQELIQYGADLVVSAGDTPDQQWDTSRKVRLATSILQPCVPVAMFAAGDPPSREWAAMLAAKQDWRHIGPALTVAKRADGLIVTRLDATGKRSRQILVASGQPVVVTMRAGVAEQWTSESPRTGKVVRVNPPSSDSCGVRSESIPADPATIDIRHANHLVAGGRGLGSKAGFDLLRQFASAIDASVAASRMAVDLGWIDFERQVGQTGKTVAPDLYIACGISGASHHLQGMRDAQHIIAINTDTNAPIFGVANLSIASDLFGVLETALNRLNRD